MNIFTTEFQEKELCDITAVIRSGDLGYGSNVSLFEEQFQSFSNKQHNIGTNSASGAAFMIFAYLKEKYGECDVYTPSLAFTSPAWAAMHHGHNIKWVDVNDQLLFNCDDYLQKRNSCSNNKVVLMPILYGGVSTIPTWNIVGDEIVVVDSAHCPTPTIDCDYSFFSFHPYKPICSSDGGMISTNNTHAGEWFRCYRNFGRQDVDNTYDICQPGFKFYMNNLNATLALTSIKKYQDLLQQRKLAFQSLQTEVGIFGELLFNVNILPHDENSSYYFATVIADDNNIKSIKRAYPTQTCYPLLHKTTYFNTDDCLSNIEKIHKYIVNIPLYASSYTSTTSKYVHDECCDIWSGG